MLANELTDRIRALGVTPTTFVLRTGRVEAGVPRAVMVMLPLTGYEDGTDQQGGFYKGGQQIVVRSPDPEEAYAVSVALQEAMKVSGGEVQLEKWTLKMFRPQGLPLLFPINDADLYETSLRFSVAAYSKP